MVSKKMQIKDGALAGLIASIVFGIMMLQMMPGVLPKIANLYGFSSAGAGFIFHLIHGTLIGGVYGFIPGVTATKVASSFYGLIYGFAWWILGSIIVMPLWLAGSTRLSADGIQAALPSLPGHLVYGIILGLLFIVFSEPKQSTQESQPASDGTESVNEN